MLIFIYFSYFKIIFLYYIIFLSFEVFIKIKLIQNNILIVKYFYKKNKKITDKTLVDISD